MAPMTEQLENYFDRLWPICRSILGPGFRDSLKILQELVPFETLHFSSGERVFDWVVPREWVARDAYIIGPDGRKFCDFTKNNLHLVNYSIPFRGKVSLEELDQHLYSLPELPNAIPYVTSYYKERWGFCIEDSLRKALKPGAYEVFIDTELCDGELVVGETVLPGESRDEILFSSYLCHPSMANNELSGPLALCFLYQKIKALPRRKYTYRFVCSAETIGTIAYLSVRGDHLKEYLKAGYQITCVGDRGSFTLKTSRQENSLADRAARAVLQELGVFKHRKFDPADGSDERQYCSPGFNLPVASFMRTMYAEYPEYHTSLDNKDFICFRTLQESIEVLFKITMACEENGFYLNKSPMGEPQLGKYGLYPSLGGAREIQAKVRALMWTLNYADGKHDIFEIAEKSECQLSLVQETIRELKAKNLISTAGASLREPSQPTATLH